MIYFVQFAKRGPIKIGLVSFADRENPRYKRAMLESRIGGLQTGCPYELRLLAAVDGNRDSEAWLHYQFYHLHIRGEWFHPAPELLEMIKKLIEKKVALPTSFSKYWEKQRHLWWNKNKKRTKTWASCAVMQGESELLHAVNGAT